MDKNILALSLLKTYHPKVLSLFRIDNDNSLLDSIDNLIFHFKEELATLDINSYINALSKRNIKFLTLVDKYYPPLLLECEDPPLVIYYVGNKELLAGVNLISIVGSRKITSYGKRILDKFVPQLTNFTVVSGLAFGTDAYAHKLSLLNNIPTIAVLPFSCDVPTPKENTILYNKIKENGLIISEHPINKQNHKGLYPKRNRIIAGLSQKTIVVEAGIESGALITAKLAFDYNRDVYAFPGSNEMQLSAGCNYLIKNNIAKLIEDFSDIDVIQSSNRLVNSMSEIESKVYYAILPGSKNVNQLAIELGMEYGLILRICTKLQINGILNTDNTNQFYVT